MAKEQQKDKEHKCSQCDFVATGNYGAQELGRHLKFKHGIAGGSASAKTEQKKRASSISPEDIEAKRAKWREQSQASRDKRKKLEKANEQEDYSYKAASNKKQSRESDTLALVTVGRLTQIVEEIATKHSIAKEQFTRRCAELFHASTLW
jgi:TPP-dependent indolepyruvate ferredoxin oxidoreductase alpha subunit